MQREQRKSLLLFLLRGETSLSWTSFVVRRARSSHYTLTARLTSCALSIRAHCVFSPLPKKVTAGRSAVFQLHKTLILPFNFPALWKQSLAHTSDTKCTISLKTGCWSVASFAAHQFRLFRHQKQLNKPEKWKHICRNLGKIKISLIPALNVAAVQLPHMTVKVQTLSHLSPPALHHCPTILQET